MGNGILLIGVLGLGTYLWARKKQKPDCKTSAMRTDLRDAWSVQFDPPLNVFYLGIAEPWPELPYELRGATAVAIIASTGEFFVYDKNFRPQPSPNLRDSFCRFADMNG